MKTISLFSILALLLVFLTSCDTSSKAISSNQVSPSTFPPLFKQVLTAHGGLAQWRKMKTLKFTRGSGKDAAYHLINLDNRDEVITKEEVYTVGYQGDNLWIAPNREAYPGKSARFYHNLHFYFFALPFVLADPGVNLVDEGEKMSGGKNYRILKATFNSGVGDAPGDQYILYIDPSSHRIHMINYSVTYFDSSKATQYNALVYQWKEVNSLVVPSNLSGYKWDKGELQEKRYSTDISRIAFSEVAMPASAFTAPKGAYIESDK